MSSVCQSTQDWWLKCKHLKPNTLLFTSVSFVALVLEAIAINLCNKYLDKAYDPVSQCILRGWLGKACLMPVHDIA